MGSDWKTFTLEELASEQKSALATGPFGSAISSKFFQENGIPVIRGGNLSANTSDRMSDDGLVFVSEEKAAEFKRSVVRKGDLIFTCWGTINQVGLLDEQRQFDEYIISNKQMKVTLDVDKADPLFVYYMFSGPKKQKEILQNGIGAAVPGFNLGQLREHKLTLPNINKQRRIASYLDSLDQKITLNNQINQTLEQMAQTLFKSWFVDFDPVKAKMNGEQPKGMDAPFLSKEVASLFPEKLVESELGLIPEGWDVDQVGNHIAVTKGKSYKSAELQESTTALVTLKSFKRGGGYRMDGLKEYTGKYKPQQVIEAGDLVMSLTDVTQAAEIVGKPALVIDAPQYDTLVASLDVAILRSKEADAKQYFYGLMNTYRFHRYAESFATGTTVLHLSPKGITTFEFACPSAELVKKYNDFAAPIFAKIEANILESQELAKLRDTLLPKLLSGEIDLENVQVEQAKSLAE
ncbi:restriction endonuclease subunit S [Vibrio cyclitrophicus]